jgi:hypothetical protein
MCSALNNCLVVELDSKALRENFDANRTDLEQFIQFLIQTGTCRNAANYLGKSRNDRWP